METLKKSLIQRFGENNVSDFSVNEGYIDLFKINVVKNTSYTLLITNGMSNYKMPVLDRYSDWEFSELYFCLPEYWDLSDIENPRMNWPMTIIQKLATHVLEDKTWYGPGHTITNGNPPNPLSSTMKQQYLILTEPIEMEDYLQPLNVEGKKIRFLAIIPLFKKEFIKKQSKGYNKWIKRFRLQNGNEILDDFRTPIVKRFSPF